MTVLDRNLYLLGFQPWLSALFFKVKEWMPPTKPAGWIGVLAQKSATKRNDDGALTKDMYHYLVRAYKLFGILEH